ncbi:MAG: carbohydrate porin [Deltaproteobacteria bacterium]|nr:carbohydrate porin [Deltaproteobacteria bacterium]
MVRKTLMLLAGALFFASPALAQDDVEDLKRRVQEIENKVMATEPAGELGHKLHPIHSLYGLKVGGSVTLVGQGSSADGAKGDLALSADLVFESPVGTNGTAVLVFDIVKGRGVQGLPGLFTGPNGSATGTNADLEGFNNDVNLTQAYYEHVYETLTVSVGQIDPTGYFDTNDFANNERVQFLANIFVNNPAIEFGGTENFYSPGIRATFAPSEIFDVSLGAFEGNGDYVDAFDKPFLMAEANLNLKLMDLDGHYRLYYWTRQGRDDVSTTANPNDASLLEETNSGFGVSLDQLLTDNFGVWFRAGLQDEKVAQFDKFFAAGIHVNGDAFGREYDRAGFGYGVTLMGQDYEDFLVSEDPDFASGAEHYAELYYNMALAHADDEAGFHITPDIQYVMNPGGDENADSFFVYGLRLQAFF